MARIINRLATLTVVKITEHGFYPDGNGLFLQVRGKAAKSWIFRFRFDGKRHYLGLGPFPLVSLAEAREKADTARRERLTGKNPLDAGRRKKAETRRQEQAKAASTITSREAGKKYIATHKAAWKNEKHIWQWEQILESFANPVIGDLPVDEVGTEHILQILEPLWLTNTETASRLRGRLEKILDWARVKGFRQDENPARWKGHLDKLLPKKSRVQKKKHYPALPFAELPAFMLLLRQKKGISALALQFQILNTNRSDEVFGARWQEFDLAAGVWLIPAERMKMEEEHRVPLSPPALDILKAMQAVSDGDYVFPGRRGDKPLSDMALTQLIRRMHADELKAGRKGFLDPKYNEVAVPHGFRSSFKDWAAETADFANEVTEMALAHAIESKVEGAYRRGDLFKKRRNLMQAWADYALSACYPKVV